MILPKKTLEQLDYYTVNQRYAYPHTVYDVITLFFRPFWKRKRVIEIKRMVTEFFPDDTFTHKSSSEARDLICQLERHVISTFEDNEPQMKKKAPVFELVPGGKK
jgi:hypothetical protein